MGPHTNLTWMLSPNSSAFSCHIFISGQSWEYAARHKVHKNQMLDIISSNGAFLKDESLIFNTHLHTLTVPNSLLTKYSFDEKL